MGSGTQPAGPVVEWQTDALGMSPWSDRDAKLYRIELEVRAGDRTLDCHTQTFGLRRMTRDGVDLYLNGDPIFLRGVTDHCFWAATCNPPADKQSYLDMLRRHRELGFNWIRFHTWIPSEEYMAAADELGMLLMVEAPRDFAEPEWLDILRTCRRHPSVVIYSGGNEQCLDEQRIEMLAHMAALQKARVPDALLNPQEALRGAEYCWSEEDYGGNTVDEPFHHNPDRMARLKEFSDVFGQYSWGFLSYNLVAADRHELDRRHAIYGAPLLAHEISIKGSYIDFDLEHRMAGTRIGTGMYESPREILTDAGLYQNAATYYRNSCAWLRIFRKHVIEMARKCQFNRGYDLLGGHDHHVQSKGFHGGLMNDFFELKPGESVADVRQYNNESVLLLDTSNDRNLAPGDAFDLPLLLSFYSRPDIESARIDWHVMDDADRVVARGGWDIGPVASGTLTEIGRVQFAVPQVPAATKLRVFVRLSSDHHELTNDWDYWAFPSLPTVELARRRPRGHRARRRDDRRARGRGSRGALRHGRAADAGRRAPDHPGRSRARQPGDGDLRSSDHRSVPARRVGELAVQQPVQRLVRGGVQRSRRGVRPDHRGRQHVQAHPQAGVPVRGGRGQGQADRLHDEYDRRRRGHDLHEGVDPQPRREQRGISAGDATGRVGPSSLPGQSVGRRGRARRTCGKRQSRGQCGRIIARLE